MLKLRVLCSESLPILLGSHLPGNEKEIAFVCTCHWSLSGSLAWIIVKGPVDIWALCLSAMKPPYTHKSPRNQQATWSSPSLLYCFEIVPSPSTLKWLCVFLSDFSHKLWISTTSKAVFQNLNIITHFGCKLWFLLHKKLMEMIRLFL
jgi:hypothetical protein